MFLTNLFKRKQKLSLEDIPKWNTAKCYDCGKDITPIECWHKFVEINKKVYAVPICDECDGKDTVRCDPNEYFKNHKI